MKVTIKIDRRYENLLRDGILKYSQRFLRKHKQNLKIQLQKIADGALEAMRNYIDAKAKHSLGTLGEALTVEFRETKDTVSWGIGNTTKLTNEAPYWYVLNYGRTTSGEKFIPTGTIGYINEGRPIAGKKMGKGDVMTSEAGGHLIIPKTFTPINYIAIGVSHIKEGMRSLRAASKN